MGDRYVWLDAADREHDLPVVDPKEGAGMPPIELASELVPEQAGARFRHARHDVRVVDLTLAPRSFAGDPDEVRTKLRSLYRALDPVRGAGRIRRIRPSGESRDLVCYYSGGLELEERDPAWQVAVATFRAFDPYWRDSSDALVTFGDANAFFPVLPLEVSSEETLGATTVTNDGDVDTWPVWEVVGPGDNLRLINDTTGKVLELTAAGGVALAAGETITIDTRPGAKTVRLGDGTNLYPKLTTASSLWPLIRGTQAMTIELQNVATESRVNLTYRRRYLGA